MVRPSPKLIHHRDQEEVKLWADKVHNRFPCLPVWSVGAFFSGVITVSQPVPHFVLPEAAEGFVLTHLGATFQSGSLTGSTIINVHRISQGNDTLLGTITLLSSDSANKLYVVEVGPVDLLPRDIIRWDCTNTGNHASVTAIVMGRQAS